MKHRIWAFYAVVVFPVYVMSRASFSIPVWFDILVGAVLGFLILPVLFFRSSAAAFAVVIVFLLALPSLSSMQLSQFGQSGLLFLFVLWVILILVLVFDRM